MHELSLAMGLLEMVTDQAHKAGLTSVKRVDIEIGALQGVEPTLLAEAFKAIAEGGLADGVELTYTVAAAKAKCRACSCEFSPTYTYYVCPDCHQADVSIVSGRDLFLKSLTGDGPEE